MKKLNWISVMVFAALTLWSGPQAHALDRPFLSQHHGVATECLFSWRSEAAKNRLYLDILERTKAATGNTKWELMTWDSYPYFDFIDDPYEESIMMAMHFRSRDAFYAVQDALIRAGAESSQFSDTELMAAVAAWRARAGNVFKTDKLAQFLISNPKENIQKLIGLSYELSGNMNHPWSFTMRASIQATKKPDALPWVAELYSFTQGYNRAEPRVNQLGFLSGTADELRQTVMGNLQRIQIQGQELKPTIEAIEELYGALAHLEVMGQTTRKNVEFAIKANESLLKSTLSRFQSEVADFAPYFDHFDKSEKYHTIRGMFVRTRYDSVASTIIRINDFLRHFDSGTGLISVKGMTYYYY